MNFSFLITMFIIAAILFSGVLSSLSMEVGIFAGFLLLGALSEGPASAVSPSGLNFF